MKKLLSIIFLLSSLTFAQFGAEFMIASGGYSGYTPTANTVLYYSLDGNSNDGSGGGFNGTDNAITYGTTSGFIGQTASFNGTTSYITNASFTPLSATNTYTVLTWFKSSSTARQTLVYVKNSGGGVLANISTSVNTTDGYAYFYINTGVGGDLISGSTNICDGNRHLISASRNGANLYVYVDGSLVGSSTTATTATYTSASLYVGIVDDLSSYPLSGVQDEIIIEDIYWDGTAMLNYYNASL